MRSYKIAEFNPPDIVNLYLKNALQVLGMDLRDIKSSAVEKRKNDLIVMQRSGHNPVTSLKEKYMPVKWHHNSSHTKREIEEACVKLQDPRKRIQEAWLWFLPIGTEQDKALDYLSFGDLEKARALWAPLAKSNNQMRTALIARHNLAILEHALLLSEEEQVNTKTNNYDKKIKNWNHTVTMLRENLESRIVFDYLLQLLPFRANRIESDLKQFQGSALSFIIQINADLSREALKQGLHRHSRFHIDVIKNSGLRESEINQAVNLALTDIFASLRLLQADYEKQCSELLPESEEYCIEIRKKYPNGIPDTFSGKCPKCNGDISESIPWNCFQKKEIYEITDDVFNKLLAAKDMLESLGAGNYGIDNVKQVIYSYEQIKDRTFSRDWNNIISSFRVESSVFDRIYTLCKEKLEESPYSDQALLGIIIRDNFQREKHRIAIMNSLVESAKNIAEIGKEIIRKSERLYYDEEQKKECRQVLESYEITPDNMKNNIKDLENLIY